MLKKIENCPKKFENLCNKNSLLPWRCVEEGSTNSYVGGGW